MYAYVILCAPLSWPACIPQLCCDTPFHSTEPFPYSFVCVRFVLVCWMHEPAHVCGYFFTYTHVNAYVHACIYTRMHIHMHAYMHMHAYPHMHAHSHIFAYTRMHTYVRKERVNEWFAVTDAGGST